MTRIKQQVLREFGDDGADTLRRYFAQLEYTAYWCIRMLRHGEFIEAVTPEGVEDLVIERESITELHQVKTRDESQGMWTIADVLPILCQQYYRRKAFPSPYRFYFVSDQRADNERRSKNSFGSLYRLKFLLAVEHDGQSLKDEEREELCELESVLIPKIWEHFRDKHKEDIDEASARSLLHSTWIETDCPALRDTTNQNLIELGEALSEVFPGVPSPSHNHLKEMYCRLLVLVAKRIIIGISLEERRITRPDVLNCRWSSCSIEGQPDLNKVPGDTVMDKKLYLGGFDPTEWPRFHRQKALAGWTVLKLENLGLQQSLERLSVAIVDLHGECRHHLCRNQKIIGNPGPHILEQVRSSLSELGRTYFPEDDEVNEQFCLGLLWRETDSCHAWWHGLDGSDQEVTT
ncbi:MAG: dsDNA nuclease domain-containing protein [Acidobacteria bacterium]|nr:dsDNA nuclease domain-containing protein [Acidobacteriota bacterium]